MSNKNLSEKIQILFNQFNAKNFDLVISKTKPLIKKNPGYVILYNLLGSAYQNIGDYNNAKTNFIEGLKLENNNIAIMNNLAMAHKNLLQYDKAQNLYDKILNLNKNYINAYVNLGNLKRDLNKFDEAIELYKKSLKINDKNPIIYYSLSLAYQGLGKFDEAIKYAKKTLELNKYFTQADHLISQSTKYDKYNEHYKSLLEKIKDPKLENYQKIDLYFSLAKAEEDFGDIEKATKNLLAGNLLKKKELNYNVTIETNLLENIKKEFKQNKFNFKNKKNDKNIIFILGMPRSGTSLVEQIITSHNNVFGAGELPILSNIIKENFIINNKLNSENLKQITEETFAAEQLRNNYLNFIKNFDFSEQYITDKAPLNFRWIGFIKLLFPDSKIIHCSRDPKNNCLSMFKNLFEGGLNFTYDQKDLVLYYKKYLELMDFWKSLFGDSIFDVNYENLVQNKEKEIKKIIKFCDLDWQEDCLTFHNNKTPIKTMSTAQARKPIYSSSLNSFEKFSKYLNILNKDL